MANRQYIGARYVPIVYSGVNSSSDWVSGVAYEPLTIVTYLNNSFTSRIPVPASVGNPADNPTYWAVTGNYNAQVEGYRQQVVQVSQDVDDLTTTVNNLSERVSKEGINKVIIIGDSYNTTDTPSGGTAITPWGPLLVQYLGLASGSYWNSGVSGAGFIAGTTFLQQLQSLSDNISDKGNVSHIIVAGGVNDGNEDYSDIVTAINSFCSYCATNYPNATVHLFMISWNTGNTKYLLANRVLPAYQAGSRNTNCIYHPYGYLPMHNYANWNGDAHPGSSAGAEIACLIKNAILGSPYTDMFAQATPTLTLASGLTGTFLINQWLTTGGAQLSIALTGTCQFSPERTISNSPVSLGYISRGLIDGINEYTGALSTNAYLVKGSTWQAVTAEVYLEGLQLFVRFYTADGNNVTNVTGFRLAPISGMMALEVS